MTDPQRELDPGRDRRERDRVYHDAIGREYDAVVVTPRRLLNDLVLGACRPLVGTGGTMLDLGAGTGHATRQFGRAFRRVVMVDHSAGMLAAARENLTAPGFAHVRFHEGDVAAFLDRTDAGSVDFIACIGFLHHLGWDELEALLRRASQLLAPGGRLLVSEPREQPSGAAPPEVLAWNQAAAVPGYGTEPPDEPEEGPIDEKRLRDALDRLGFRLRHAERHWALFPHGGADPSAEVEQMVRLHERFGSSGNVTTLVLEKPGRVRAFPTWRERLRTAVSRSWRRSFTADAEAQVRGHLEEPAEDGAVQGLQRIRGWLLDGRLGTTSLEAEIDGEPVPSSFCRRPRPDVTDAIPDARRENPEPGFDGVVDLRGAAPGARCLTIRTLGAGGSAVAATARVVVRPHPLASRTREHDAPRRDVAS